jgi:hypothetical protein
MTPAESVIVFFMGIVRDLAPIMLFLAALVAVGYVVSKLAKRRKDLGANEQGAPIFDSYQSWNHNNTATHTTEDGRSHTVVIEHPIVDAFQTNYVKRWWGDE